MASFIPFLGWLPCSEFMIAGTPYLFVASCRGSTQKSASSVFDICYASTHDHPEGGEPQEGKDHTDDHGREGEIDKAE